MKDPLFSGLRLVGGTALALQIGHRSSVDIDLFGNKLLEESELADAMERIGTIKWINKLKNIKSVLLDGVKTDFVNYRYHWLDKPLKKDGIRLATPKDIAAMKLSAITGRGAKKDFVDLYFLLESFTLHEMISFFTEKYPDGSAFLVLKSLVYFEDAETDEMPRLLKAVSWDKVKKTIVAAHREYIARNG